MFGPLFRYELTRLARRGLQPKLRAAFAGLLLVVLFLSYLAAFPRVGPLRLLTRIDEPLTIEAASRFGEYFLVAFLYAQAIVVVLVTPAVVGGAIGEEKDRRSLDLLLTTSLSSWEIVAGKLAARLVFIGSLLLTGLPVVTLVIFLGGVDIGQLLAGYAIAVCTMCSLGAFTLWLTVINETSGEAILRGYIWGIGLTVAGVVCGCMVLPTVLSPIATILVILEGWGGFIGSSSPATLGPILAWYAGFHLVLAAVFLSVAAWQLRLLVRMPGFPASPPSEPPPAEPDTKTPAPVPTFQPPRRRISLQWMDDDPLAWKEQYLGAWNPFTASAELFTVSLLLLPLLVMAFSIAWIVGRDAGGVFALMGVAVGLAALLAAGVRAAGAVAEERSRGTLDSLLMLPVERRVILGAKFSAAFRAATPAAAWAWLVVALGVIRTALVLPALVGFPLVLAGWVVALVGFGLWLTVRCETRQRAVAWLLGVVLILCVIPAPLGWALADDAPLLGGFVGGLSPPFAMWAAIGPDWNWHHGGDWSTWFGALVAAGLVAGVGILFGSRAGQRFERRDA